MTPKALGQLLVLVTLNDVTNNIIAQESRVIQSQYSQYLSRTYPLKIKHSIF